MKIVIPGQPQAKMRARTCNTKRGVKTFDPQSQEKNSMRWKIKAEINKQRQPDLLPTELPVSIELRFYLQPLTGDKDRNLKLFGLYPNTGRKDLDNLEKFILDCGNKILYEDDSQIIEIRSSKHWSDDPRTEIDMNIKQSSNLSPDELKIINLFSPEDFVLLEHISKRISQELAYCTAAIDWERLIFEMIALSQNFADKFAKVKKITKEWDDENSTD